MSDATATEGDAPTGAAGGSSGGAATGSAGAAGERPDAGDTAADGTAQSGTDHGPDERTRRLWTLLIFTYVALEGAGLQMRGAVLPTLGAEFAAPEWQLGLVAPAGTLGFLTLAVVVGAVAGRIDPRRTLVVGMAGTGLGLLLMGVAPVFPFFLGALLLRGGMTGLGRGIDRPVLSHLHPSRRARVFNLYDMSWAVGATLGPLLVAGAIALGEWRLAYYLLAAAFVPLVALALWLPAPDVGGGEEPLDRAKLRRLLRTPAVSGTSVALFLSVGVEGGLFTWLPYYAGSELPPSLAGLTLSVMLAAYVPGRLFAGRFAERYGSLPFGAAVLAALVPALVVTFTVAEGLWLLPAVAVVGLLVSTLYPTFIAFATEAAPEHSAPVNAIANVTSSAGIAAVPAAMGVVIGGSGARVAMQLLLVPLVGALAVVGAIGFVERR